jgi:hypothetical protein
LKTRPMVVVPFSGSWYCSVIQAPQKYKTPRKFSKALHHYDVISKFKCFLD